MRFYVHFYWTFFLMIFWKFGDKLPVYSVNAELEEGFEFEVLEIPIDHFSTENTNPTFKLHYAINNKYWNKEYGAIFFYAGCREGLKQTTSILPTFAKEFNALVIYAEHRYYGQSMPFGDESLKDPKYLQYLSTRQVLEDFVDLLFFVKTGSKRTAKNAAEYNTGRNPVIAFGGSYTGMLAAWFRKKYPHIVEGSLASSAPMFLQTVDCNVYYKKLTAIYEKSVKGCSNLIRKSWAIMNNILSSDSGKEWFSDNWNLCTKIENSSDIKTFKSWLRTQYWDTASYSAPFSFYYPKNPVKVICNSIKNTSDSKDFLMSLHSGVNRVVNYSGSEADCFDYKETETWYIQACMEFVQPVCTNGQHDMFEPESWDFQKYSEDCYKKYKVRPVHNYIKTEYGTINKSNTSNIIFSNGILDQWSVAGILKNLSESLIAIQITGATHCWDLRRPRWSDSDVLKNARNKCKTTFRYWIHNYYRRNGIEDIEKKYPIELDVPRQKKIVSAPKKKSKVLVKKI